DVELVADLSLEAPTPAHVMEHPEIWEDVIRKLRGHLMPPPASRQPAPGEIERLVGTLEGALDRRAAERGPAPGRVNVHRLNRTEYARAIADLLAVDIDAAAILPADVVSDGFDNVADVLRVSPTHLEQYVAAARDISI